MQNKMIFFGIILSGVMGSCNMNKNSDKDNTVNMSEATDTSMMAKNSRGVVIDSSVNNKISNSNMDSSVDSKKGGIANPDLTKKGKKGKVRIVLNDTKGSGDMNMDKEGYYANTEILPGFPDGEKALGNFFEKNIQYPQDATDNGVEGTVKINFAVDEKGKVYAPKIMSEKIGYGVEEEALKAFKKMPAWTPGKIKGRNVKTRFTLPVTFQLY